MFCVRIDGKAIVEMWNVPTLINVISIVLLLTWIGIR